jgi:AraC-like DNA-binding protein
MVGLGMLMLLLGVWSLWLRSRQRLFRSKPFLRFVVMMGPSGLIAILTGWYTTEIGRQPWVMYGVMRTKDAVSNHSALALSVTLIPSYCVEEFHYGLTDSQVVQLPAQVADLSRMHFAKPFRAATGCRPHNYLLYQRIESATATLSSTDMPLAEIALNVGFQAQAHFSTVFEHLTGETAARWGFSVIRDHNCPKRLIGPGCHTAGAI